MHDYSAPFSHRIGKVLFTVRVPIFTYNPTKILIAMVNIFSEMPKTPSYFLTDIGLNMLVVGVLGGPRYDSEKQYTIDLHGHPYVTVGTQRLRSSDFSWVRAHAYCMRLARDTWQGLGSERAWHLP